MISTVQYFSWFYGRAFVWIAFISFALYRATRNAKVSRTFFFGSLAALGLGGATDFFMVNLAPKSWLVIDVLQWVFIAPVVTLTVVSLWIGNREVPVTVPDVFMTLTPLVMWALMVVYGWQSMWYCHVLGAWLVAAASGGVDLYARCGAPWARRRSWLTRSAGYVLVVAAVYLLLPLTEQG